MACIAAEQKFGAYVIRFPLIGVGPSHEISGFSSFGSIWDGAQQEQSLVLRKEESKVSDSIFLKSLPCIIIPLQPNFYLLCDQNDGIHRAMVHRHGNRRDLSLRRPCIICLPCLHPLLRGFLLQRQKLKSKAASLLLYLSSKFWIPYVHSLISIQILQLEILGCISIYECF